MHAVKEKVFIEIKPVREIIYTLAACIHLYLCFHAVIVQRLFFGLLFAKGRPHAFIYRDLLTLFRGEGVAVRLQPNLSGGNLVTFCNIYQEKKRPQSEWNKIFLTFS